jgi:hypothetical protein
MIFPASLPVVTFYFPEQDTYYELTISGAQTTFQAESFYQRESISAQKQTKFRGLRFSLSMSFSQSNQHSLMRDFWNAVYDEIQQGGDEIHVYLKAQSSIADDDDYFELVPNDFLANLAYRNTIGRHGYDLSFTGKITVPEITGVDVIFVIVDNGDFVINDAGEFIIVEAFGG